MTDNIFNSELIAHLGVEQMQQQLWCVLSVSGFEKNLYISQALKDLIGDSVSSLEEFVIGSNLQKLKQIIDEITHYLENHSEVLQGAPELYSSTPIKVILKTKQGDQTAVLKLGLTKQNSNPLRPDSKNQSIIFISCFLLSELQDLLAADATPELLSDMAPENSPSIKGQIHLDPSFEKQAHFLAMLSHELRAPLLSTSGLVKRLKYLLGGLAEPEAMAMLKEINATTEETTYLVNDILTYTQIQSNSIKLRAVELSLNELIGNVKVLTKSMAADKGLNLSLAMDITDDLIWVDSIRLTQVLINLVINASKFTLAGGITIKVQQLPENNYLFTVIDSGVGIKKTSLEQVFKPFAQLEKETGTATINAGLGLFICKELVKRLGGNLEVSSSLDKGTEFNFVLKLNKEYAKQQGNTSFNDGFDKDTNLNSSKKVKFEQTLSENDIDKNDINSPTDNRSHRQIDATTLQNESEALNQAIKGATNSIKPTRVLVADDSEINRMVLAGYLEDLHCDVIEACDGQEAWKILEQESFDYVLLDIQMPRMDGVEVASKINAAMIAGCFSSIKGVFAITAGGQSHEFDFTQQEKAQKLFDQWLIKPINKEQIMDLLSQDFKHLQLEDLVSATEKEPKVIASTATAAEQNSLITEESGNEDLVEVVIENIPVQFHALVPAFIAEMQQKLAELQRLNNSADEDASSEIKAVAHYLKGNAMLFQLSVMVDLLKQLEATQDSTCDNEKAVLAWQNTNKLILEKLIHAVKNLENSLPIGDNDAN